MSLLLAKARTAWAIGPSNIARVGWYKARLRAGLHPVQRISAPAPRGPFFAPPRLGKLDVRASTAWNGEALLFGRHRVPIGFAPPAWLNNPLTGQAADGAGRAWWRIPDFDAGAGDIKLIWELSRMDWLLPFAQRARNGDADSLSRLNLWLEDWCAANPPYRGHNWKCGQEASIRVLHLAAAAMILGQAHQTCPGLIALVSAHLERIAPTMAYAAAQDNNHATSEAAALFIGGSWLTVNGVSAGIRFAEIGRRELERRVARLIAKDGSFSQYSVNYHRVALDTLSLAETWRQALDLATFSPRFRARAAAAARWLRAMVEPGSGDAPNLGANDGARLIPLTDTAYRDHRPSVQLASALFEGSRAFGPGPHDDALAWLGLSLPQEQCEPIGSALFDCGGFAVLRKEGATAVLRYPRFRFRPSQADPLHLDLWSEDENLLRDGGTYSYNGGAEWLAYFGGVASHNSVQFDDDEPMRRIGRFLLADWLKTDEVAPLRETPEAVRFAVAYRDRAGRRHARSVELSDGRLEVRDDVSGFARTARLRWRLPPGDWRLEGVAAVERGRSLRVNATVPITELKIVTGHESRHYFELTELPVLEAEIDEPGAFETICEWRA